MPNDEQLTPTEIKPKRADIKRTPSEISQQVAQESERRARLGVPATAAGILYMLSGIIISSTVGGAPSVGVLQGLEPALKGEANPAVSPRAGEIRFDSHHAFGLVAGSVLVAIAIGALVLALLFLQDATRFRRPQSNRAARPLVMVGGALMALLSVLTQVLLAIKTHDFAAGHDFSNHAVNAVTHNTSYDILAYVTPIAAIALAAGMIITVTNSVKVGLMPRWMGIVGGVSAVLLLVPAATLDLIPSFWLVATGILLMERFPKGDPPAWAAGEARPWPTQAELRAERETEGSGSGKRPGGGSGSNGKGARGAQPALQTAGADVAPEPIAHPGGSSRKRRRKRGRR